jgi:hypothetical protein
MIIHGNGAHDPLTVSGYKTVKKKPLGEALLWRQFKFILNKKEKENRV